MREEKNYNILPVYSFVDIIRQVEITVWLFERTAKAKVALWGTARQSQVSRNHLSTDLRDFK